MLLQVDGAVTMPTTAGITRTRWDVRCATAQSLSSAAWGAGSASLVLRCATVDSTALTKVTRFVTTLRGNSLGP